MSHMIEQLCQLVDASRIVDLSYPFHPDMPAWPTQPRFQSSVYADQTYGDGSYHCAIHFSEHTGTHVDAPRHFIVGGATVDQLDVRQLMGRGVLVDAEGIAPCEAYTLDKLLAFEAEHGPIQAGDIVLFRFGWDLRYGLRPAGGGYLQDWPGLSVECAEYLRDKGVRAVGCDTLALDPFTSETYPCHSVLLGSGILILENLYSLSRLPVFSYVIGLPLKFSGGSGSPLRIIALCEEKGT